MFYDNNSCWNTGNYTSSVINVLKHIILNLNPSATVFIRISLKPGTTLSYSNTWVQVVVVEGPKISVSAFLHATNNSINELTDSQGLTLSSILFWIWVLFVPVSLHRIPRKEKNTRKSLMQPKVFECLLWFWSHLSIDQCR